MSLPLQAYHKANGGVFREIDGEPVLMHFGDPAAEYRSLEEGAVLFDLSHRGKLDISGEDRLAFLNGQVSNDILRLRTGAGCLAAVLDHRSRILGDMRVLAVEDRLLADLEPGLQTAVLDVLRRYLLRSKTALKDVSGRYALFSMQGRKAGGILKKLFQLDLDALPAYGHETVSYGGGEARLVKVSRTGRPGADFWCPSGGGQTLWECLREAGAVPAGDAVSEPARIEGGVARYGIDMDESNLVLEANLPNAVSTTKGCYIGQEVVARIVSRGHVNKLLTGFILDQTVPCGTAVRTGEGPAGKITSCAWSPKLEKAVALGYIKYAFAGRKGLEIKAGGVKGRLSPPPFV